MFSFRKKTPKAPLIERLHEGSKQVAQASPKPLVLPEGVTIEAPPEILAQIESVEIVESPDDSELKRMQAIDLANQMARDKKIAEEVHKAHCVAKDILKYFGKNGVSEDIVKRHISIAGLPNWQSHNYPLLQRVVAHARARVADVAFVETLAAYYRSIGFGGTEAIARFILLHAVFEAFSEYLTKDLRSPA